ncbi:beta-galactosidase [Prevotella sp. oral taxon 820]|nr:beta-galactosidase [Prevotella sp. oral taxon 820]
MSLQAKTRIERDLRHWSFSRDSVRWQTVEVPHDWAIDGPFDKRWDLQRVAIEQNGERQATEKSGRSGALPWIGRGYYRTTVSVPADCRHAELLFDGAMSEPVVYVNGRKAGRWAYGYNAFRVDITPFLNRNGRNMIVVSLNNREESSRWYPGAGLYRPVKLITTAATRLDDWSVFVRTVSLTPAEAQLRIDWKAVGPMKGKRVEGRVIDDEGHVVAAFRAPTGQTAESRLLTVARPRPWSPESPALYRLSLDIRQADGRRQAIDRHTTRFGIRTVTVGREGGFMLNGRSRKFKGVCLHHDLGPLGTAVNKAALIRQIETMKEMGCDAIRTSHNMPSTMQMEVCDSLGMMVMAESFDMWFYPKCKNGYVRFFGEWADRDITNLVLNHRNHPSIVMWSIGNEIPEQWSEEGRETARRLQDLCHRLDPTRPVTQGIDRIDEALRSGFAQVMDVPGYNYRDYKYSSGIGRLPQGFLLGSETASTVSSRGVYKFPVTISDHAVYPDGQCSGYDTEFCSWSNLPDADFLMQDDRPYTIGQFVWTGYDYLGEPTPYDEYWPSRSSYFGICDLAGLPKDRYWLYRSVWNKRKHTLHLLPHWTWPGREGQTTPVFVYTDYPEAELFINGKSQGRLRHTIYSLPPADEATEKRQMETMDLLRRYRLMWTDVTYEPGEVKVVAYDATGKAVDSTLVRTAGSPARLRLEPDRPVIHADGDDLCFITVSMTDEAGNLVPTADDQLIFDVEGAGAFKAVCNGDATSLESFTRPQMKLFAGQLVLVVKSGTAAGDIRVTVRAPRRNLSATLRLKAK